jgi:hypothetical protein
MFQADLLRKSKHTLHVKKNYPPPESRAVYEIICKKYGAAGQATAYGCLPDIHYVKNTDINSEYLIFIACPKRQW